MQEKSKLFLPKTQKNSPVYHAGLKTNLNLKLKTMKNAYYYSEAKTSSIMLSIVSTNSGFFS
jgi:hypothetical protein